MEEEIKKISYSDEEKKHISYIKDRLQYAKQQRDAPLEEFDGMTYVEAYESDERGANTYIEPKKDKFDNNFQSGTIRSKIMSILTEVINLNFSPEISSLDRDNNEIESLGDSLEDIIEKTEESENDKEKKGLRYYELIKHGTVFVEDVEKYPTVISKEYSGSFDGSIKTFWKERKKELLHHPERSIISGLGVYLGDLRQYFIESQPFIFTVEDMSYIDAKSIYGDWERWKYVPKKVVREPITEGDVEMRDGWRITDSEKEDSVEIIKYQDKPNNEYAIFINGILMTPIGMPFLWAGGEYTITQQNLEPIRMDFAYGKSLVSKLRSNVAIYDHMLRLGVKKTEKSFRPPRANLSGKAISSKMFEAGAITNSVDPNRLPLMEPNQIQGMTNAEMMFIQKLGDVNDNNSVSKGFQGQTSSGEQTATETVLAQRQAEHSIGMIVNMCAMLDYKLAWKRLNLIIENWFEPVGTELDDSRNEIVNRYRSISTEKPIYGKGLGRVITMVDNKSYTSRDVSNMQKEFSKRSKTPVKINVINPDVIKKAKIIWRIVITSKEQKTSELSKLMYERFMAGLQPFINDVNMQYVEDEYASIWGKNSSKLYRRGEEANPQAAPNMNNQSTGQSPIAQLTNGGGMKSNPNGSQSGVPETQGLTRATV